MTVPAPNASAPAQWWEIAAGLSPLAILIAAVIAGVIALLTLRQRQVADDRSEWWRRTQWALDKATSLNVDEKILGMDTLAVLADSELARDAERRLFDAAWESVLSPVDDELLGGDNGSGENNFQFGEGG